MSTTPDDVQLVTRDHRAEEKAAALIYRPESAPVVAHDAADMKRILGEGGSDRLPAIPSRAAKPVSTKKNAAMEKEEAGISVFRSGDGVPVLVRRKNGATIARNGVDIVGAATAEGPETAVTTLLTALAML